MAWSEDDVVRSIRRYLTTVLDGPPWTIRVERREVRDDGRPVAVIQAGELGVIRGRESHNQGEIEYLLPITISAYPELGEDERRGRKAASDLKNLLARWVMVGTTVEAAGRDWAGPFRMPLWDYEDVDLTGPDKAGPANPHDVLFIDQASLHTATIQDPADPKRWTVICEFRATVEMPGRTEDADAAPVTGFDPEFGPA